MSARVPIPANRAFSRECVDFFGEAVQLFGIPRSVGEIFGLLYASPGPLCFSDIFEQLDISKGSASQGLQFLRDLGAVHAVRTADRRQAAGGRMEDGGSGTNNQEPTTNYKPRCEYFEPEMSLRQLVSGVLRERIVPMAAASDGRLARLRELAEQDGALSSILPPPASGLSPLASRQSKNFYLDRVEQLETWRRKLKTVLPVLTTLLGPKKK